MVGKGIGSRVVIVGAAVLGVLLIAATVLAVGVGGREETGRDVHPENGRRPGRATSAAAPRAADESSRAAIESASLAREPSPRELAAGVREVMVVAPRDDAFPAPVVVGEIDEKVVLRVDAVGFEPEARGHVEQCVVLSAGIGRCGNRFPVQFDHAGAARFQYLVGDRYHDPGVGAPTCTGEDGCVVRLTDGTVTAVVHTVFGDPGPRSRVTIMPSPTRVTSGERVEVTLDRFVPGDRVRVTVCAAPASAGTRRCGAPGPVARVAIDPDGTAATRLALREGPVGTERVVCGRDVPCAIVVTGGGAAAIAPVEVTFTSGPGASYDVGRIALGLALAAALVALAAFLVRTTDWRKPSEADTPVMDAAPLADV